MENSNHRDKDKLQNLRHPAPGADPGAEIETVIPSVEKEAPQAERPAGQDDAAEEPDHSDNNAGADEVDDPGTTEKNDPENEEDKDEMDEHGIETVSP